MNTRPSPKSALGLVGLAALTIYILACTSFSPDDSKVLYSTYDPKAKEFGVAVYDRAKGQSTTLFIAQQPVLDESKPEPAFLRPQWLADGRHILVSWARTADDDALDLAVLPCGHAGPTRLFHLTELPEAASMLSLPLATARGHLFLRGESNTLVQVNLLTGEVSQRETPKRVTPYAAGDEDQVCYLEDQEDADSEWELGQIDLATGALKPVAKFKLKHRSGEGGWFVATPEGKWMVAADEGPDDTAQIVVLENGVEQRRVDVATKGEHLQLGGLAFSRVSQTAYASYLRTVEGETNASAGIIEVPLPRGEPRRIPLVQRLKAEDKERVMYFQPTVSHDGKTLAIASTYLAAGDAQITDKDCALFLVNLADPKREVTRIPVPRPPEELD